jgi:hypothetical protein
LLITQLILFQQAVMKLLLPIVPRSWYLLLLVLCTTTVGRAQQQYATSVVSALNAGLVVDELKAVDSDLTTNATIAPAVLLGFTRLRVAFPKMAQANQPAGLYLRPNNPLLNLALLASAVINTYQQTGTTTTPVESFLLSSNLLNLSVLSSGVTKASFTPTKEFNQVEFVFFSVLSLGQDVGFFEAFSTPVAPLPVVLTSFQGRAASTGVTLQWETASEVNTRHFVVERALDAAGPFQALTHVSSAGTSTQAHRYQFLDRQPSLLNYYRLRQVDLDGTETFSPVVILRAGPPSRALTAYPSPTTSQLTVVGAAGPAVFVLDQTGRLVRRVTVPAMPEVQLDVQDLPAGVYLLHDGTTGQRTKFVKAAP